MPKLYECHNKACTLGSVANPGQFTGGITEDQVRALTGDPEAPFGEGYCPNCGQKATASKEKH